VGDGTGKQLERRILSMRARPNASLEERVAIAAMPDLATHSRDLATNAKRYQDELAGLIRSLDNTLLDEPGIGPISAAKLLACDPTRFKNESAFVRCDGTAPIPASSGKTVRYRLNRGGDRQANNAIHAHCDHPRQAGST
jgi:transposase